MKASEFATTYVLPVLNQDDSIVTVDVGSWFDDRVDFEAVTLDGTKFNVSIDQEPS